MMKKVIESPLSGLLCSILVESTTAGDKSPKNRFIIVEHGKYGYIDANGHAVIPAQYDECNDFSEGLALVQVGQQWGFIDTTGAFAIQPQFAAARGFSDSLAAVQIEEKWGFIDRKGQRLIEPIYGEATSFSEGLAAVQRLSRFVLWNVKAGFGFINKCGEWIIKPKALPLSRLTTRGVSSTQPVPWLFRPSLIVLCLFPRSGPRWKRMESGAT